MDDAALDRLAAVTLVMQSAQGGPPTRARRLLVQLALHVSQLRGALREADDDELRHIVWKLNLLAEWQQARHDPPPSPLRPSALYA